MSFTLDVNFGGRSREIPCTGTVTGQDVINGTIESQQGAQAFKAVREPKEGNE